MILRCLLLLPMLVWSVGSNCQKRTATIYYLGPDDIVVDARMIRGQVGYSWVDIERFADTMDHRKAQMVDMRCEFMMISNAMDKYMNFVVYDALYTRFSVGKMTTKPLRDDLPKGDVLREGRMAFGFSWGYDFYMGYRNKHWGLLAGIRPQWSRLSIGDFSTDSNSGGLGLFVFDYPLSVRAEWRPFSHFEYRVIASAWTSVREGVQNNGIKLEVPTFPRSRGWLFAEYTANNQQYLYLSTDPTFAKKTGTFSVGLRFGSIF